jgi:hypothetical protein
LLRDLDAVGPEFPQAVLHLVGYLPRPVDQVRVDLLPQKGGQVGEKFLGPGFLPGVDVRDRVKLFRRPTAHEEVRDKTDVVVRFAGGLGDLEGGALARAHLRHVDDGLVLVGLGLGRGR